MIPVVSMDGVGDRGTDGCYRLMPIGNGESALFQVAAPAAGGGWGTPRRQPQPEPSPTEG